MVAAAAVVVVVVVVMLVLVLMQLLVRVCLLSILTRSLAPAGQGRSEAWAQARGWWRRGPRRAVVGAAV